MLKSSWEVLHTVLAFLPQVAEEVPTRSTGLLEPDTVVPAMTDIPCRIVFNRPLATVGLAGR